MRLWVLTNEYAPYIIGGLGVVATDLSKALDPFGIDQTVLTKSNDPKISVKRTGNLVIVRFPRLSRFFSSSGQKFNYVKVLHWLNRNRFGKPDIIHIHSLELTYLAEYYKRKFNVPIVYTCHSLISKESASNLRKLMAQRQSSLLRFADQIVVPSSWELKQIELNYPSCNGKITVIGNGVTAGVPPRKYNRRKNLLFVGRLIKSKGIEELLHAIAIVAQKDPDVRLHVIGKGSRHYTGHLKGLASKLGILSKVTWHGYRAPAEVRGSYHSFGAVIVPSKEESFGLVALEALASGVPLISTRSGGLADFVNKDVAEIVDEVKSDQIAQAIRNMWQQRDLMKKRVQEGCKTALKYDWRSVAEQYSALYSKML